MEISTVKCPRIQGLLIKPVMFDLKDEIKGYSAIVNIVITKMSNSKWLSVIHC